MSNNCWGTLRVVTKNKDAIYRLIDIMTYKDPEYRLYRCKSCTPVQEEPQFIDGYWTIDLSVEGAWSCDKFFVYENGEDSELYTNLCHLAKHLDFGCELFSSEIGMGFCEHLAADHNGNLVCNENGKYWIQYPEREDGSLDYDKEPVEKFGLDGDFMDFCSYDEIYDSSY